MRLCFINVRQGHGDTGATNHVADAALEMELEWLETGAETVLME